MSNIRTMKNINAQLKSIDIQSVQRSIDRSQITARKSKSHQKTMDVTLNVVTRQVDHTLETRVHRKFPKYNTLLHASSHHPCHIINNIPKSQYLRIKRICSSEQTRQECQQDLTNRLVTRGYSKDHISQAVTQVVWRWWKISLRSEFRNTKPGEIRESHQDFLDDTTLQVQIGIVFGKNILAYVLNLCRGNFDYLGRLPDSVLLYIISFLDLEDITTLSQTSHKFKKLCNSDDLWEHIVQSLCDTITPEMKALANEIGWKQIFFTNKLQLQMQIRRRRQKNIS
ncbi:F-box only protein 36 [Protopterus annectens]|uniref:F-box only protein 36 n=1 Tax=Protopterus annectens TaxID=7888 RepID=UPI001CFB83E0|nr:F-box only protein 36 [Protopterus annectens]